MIRPNLHCNEENPDHTRVLPHCGAAHEPRIAPPRAILLRKPMNMRAGQRSVNRMRGLVSPILVPLACMFIGCIGIKGSTELSSLEMAESSNSFKSSKSVQPVSGITWKQYLADCGKNAQKVNKAKSEMLFASLYNGKLIRWTGTFDHINTIGVHEIRMKMNPTESIGTDVALDIREDAESEFMSLNKGDAMTFTARIASQGGFFRDHRLEWRSRDLDGAKQ